MPTNGKKPHHKGITKKLLKATAIKYDGKPTKVAKALGIKEPTAHRHLQKPDIKAAVLQSREDALIEAKLTRVEAYKEIKSALKAKALSWGVETKAPDRDVRLKAAKLTAEIYGDINPKNTGPTGPGIMIMPIVVVNGSPLKFKVGDNAQD